MDGCQYMGHDGCVTTTTLPSPTRSAARAQDQVVVCCAPLVREPLTAADADGLVGVFKALADPARLRLLSMIAAHEGGEACVCDLTEPLGLSQPTVSHHLKVLHGAGLVERDKRGVWAYYRLVPDALDRVADLLTAATTSTSPTP